MVEKTPDVTRCIERNELMQHARRQAVLGERRRRDGARGDEHREPLRANALDQRNDGEHFTDACAMYPDERTVRARLAGLAAALGKPGRMFLAAIEPPGQQTR